jgi:hypothetical protein
LYDEASRQAGLYDEASRQAGLYDEASRQAGLYDEASRQAAMGQGGLGATTAFDLDRVVRRLARALAAHELRFARRLLCFHRADGWRRLGYATETQHARERFGLSRSSLLARRSLVRRLTGLPALSAALERGALGMEAAAQLVRVATPRTEAAWVERALLRTVKHLREEVNASLTAVRLSGERDCPPPLESEMEGFHRLERAVLGGRANDDPFVLSKESEVDERSAAARRPWHLMLSSLAEWLWSAFPVGGQSRTAVAAASGSLRCASAPSLNAPSLNGAPLNESGSNPSAPIAASLSAPSHNAPVSTRVQMSATRSLAGVGRVVLRLRVPVSAYEWWRSLEATARRWLPARVRWIRFLCQSAWRG